jgi:hypothetical protein
MEIPDTQNKMMDSAQTKNKSEETKGVTVTAVGRIMNEYHFPGTPDYLPISVRAASLDEATTLWKAKRQPVAEKTESVEEKPNQE